MPTYRPARAAATVATMVITDKTCVGAELVGSAAGDSGSGAAVVVGASGTAHVAASAVKPVQVAHPAATQVPPLAEAPEGQNFWSLFPQLTSEATVPVAWQVFPATVKPVHPVQSAWQVLACADAPEGQKTLLLSAWHAISVGV